MIHNLSNVTVTQADGSREDEGVVDSGNAVIMSFCHMINSGDVTLRRKRQ